MNKFTIEQEKEFRGKLNKAFREFRRAGYFARQNFTCCNTCGWAEIPEDKASKVVFYHAQNNDNIKSNGVCHLSWSGNGQEIVKILTDCGIKTVWDGTEDKKIEVSIK